MNLRSTASDTRTEREGRLFLISPLVLICAIAGCCLVAAQLSEAGASFGVECGFNGYVKTGRWFPVRVSPVEGAVDFDARVMVKPPFASKPVSMQQSTGKFRGDEGGVGFVLCRSSWSTGFLRCTVKRADGRTQTKDQRLGLLGPEDCLILVVSDTPDEFDFLGSVESGNRSIVRVVRRDPSNFPTHWQEMDGVDLLILDGSDAGYSAAHRGAVAKWIAAGGNVLLTDRALIRGPDKGTWGFLPEVSASGGYADMLSESVAPILGKHAAFVRKIRGLPLQAPMALRLLSSGEHALVTGKDIGEGRALAFGLDWRNPELKDRATFEMVRRVLWSRILDMRRRANVVDLRPTMVLPREARAGFLVKPLALFLVAYVVLLGPVNWLILRKKGRPEYIVLTLPAGALVFSGIAFAIGVSLRTSDPVLHEAEVVWLNASSNAVVTGVSGLLSPDRSAYRLTMRDPDAMLRGAETQAPEDRRDENCELTFHFDGGLAVSNLKVGTWCMRFLSSRGAATIEGGISAQAVCHTNELRGKVTSRLPFVVRDCRLIHRWNTARIGDVQPGTSIEFSLPMEPATREDCQGQCPNCRRVHGPTTGYSRRSSGSNPADADYCEFIEAIGAGARSAEPWILGWQDVSTNSMAIDRPVLQWKRRRLCVLPVSLRFDGPAIAIPEGLVVAKPRGVDINPLQAGRIADIPYRLAGTDLSALFEEQDSRRAGLKPFGEASGESRPRQVYDFHLPFTAEKLESGLLRIHLDLGPPDPDRAYSACILSIYDWEKKNWVEVMRAKSGEHVKTLKDGARFVNLPFPVVRVMFSPIAKAQRHWVSFSFLELAFEGRRTDGRRTDSTD